MINDETTRSRMTMMSEEVSDRYVCLVDCLFCLTEQGR